MTNVFFFQIEIFARENRRGALLFAHVRERVNCNHRKHVVISYCCTIIIRIVFEFDLRPGLRARRVTANDIQVGTTRSTPDAVYD